MSPSAFIALAIAGVLTSAAFAQRLDPPVLPFTIHTPEPEELDVALDEIELDASRAGVAERAQPRAVREGRVTVSAGTRAVLTFQTIAGVSELVAAARELEAANPGARAQFVLYERGQPRSAATRRVLTREVALILEDANDPRGIVRAYAASDPRPLAGVPGAYVLDAGDPLTAVDLAAQLRAQAGVRLAYPLLERQQFAR